MGCLLLIAAILIGILSPVAEPPRLYGPARTLISTFSISILTALLGYFLIPFSRRALLHHGRKRRLSSLRLFVFLWRVSLLAGYGCSVYIFGWTYIVYSAWKFQGWPLIGEFLVLLPFLLSLFLSFIPLRRVELIFRPGESRLGSYLLFRLRHEILLVLIPWLTYVSLFDLLQIFPFLRGRFYDNPYGQMAVALCLMFLIYLFAPFGMRYILPTEPLSDGPLRKRLLSFSRRAGLRLRNILLWKTAPVLLSNACVVGLAGRLRYVFLSDGLLRNLTPDEVEAVYAHEAAHMKRHHVAFYLLFALTFVFAIIASEDIYSAITSHRGSEGSGWVFGAIVLAEVILYWGFLFGFLSRRLERQADLWASTSVGGIEPMVSALEKVAVADGLRSLASWRHFSVERRIEHLRRYADYPAIAAKWRRELLGGFGAFAGVALFSLAIILFFRLGR